MLCESTKKQSVNKVAPVLLVDHYGCMIIQQVLKYIHHSSSASLKRKNVKNGNINDYLFFKK